MIFIKLFMIYFFVGTLFLMMFLVDVLQLRLVSKKTGEEFYNPTFCVLFLSFYWPILILLLRSGNNEDKDS